LLWDYKQHPNVEELKELLKGYHETQNLQGAVLIGKIPYAEGKMNGGSGPVETYLMDLYSAEFIKNDEGIITNFKGHIHMDIWVSRIFAHPERFNQNLFPGESEVDLMNRYFEKNHFYRTCQSPVPDTELKFLTNSELTDWVSNFIVEVMSYTNPNRYKRDYMSGSGSAVEYLDFIKSNPAQYLKFSAHSSEKVLHDFGSESYLLSTHIANASIRQPFILLEACLASDFVHPNSLGKAYLFGKNSEALVIAGLTLTGNMMLGIANVHSTGDAFGVNFLNYIQQDDITEQVFHSLEPVLALYFLLDELQSLVSEWSVFYSENMMNSIMIFRSAVVLIDYVVKYFGLIDDRQVGYILLGDPTLKPYVDMAWCSEYRESK